MIILLRSEQGGLYWTKKRNCGKRIAASELGAVLCMHNHKTRAKLFREKKWPWCREENRETPATQHGRFWEQFGIAKMVEEFFPEDEGWILLKPGSILDFEDDFSCSPDFMASLLDEEYGVDWLIGGEIKCPYTAPIPKRKEDIKSEYLLQCFQSLMQTRSDKWILGFYDTPTATLTSYEIYPDWDLWSSLIVPRVRQFLSMVQDNSAATSTGPTTAPGKGKELRKGKKETEEAKVIRERLLLKTFPISGTGPRI